jgi:hypothetical protein
VLPAFITAADLIKNFPTQREPIIEGLLRRGEVGNLVGPSKMYKSWLLLQLALTAVFGRPVLGKFPTRSSSVLILDYELAPGTLARRLQHVASALAVTPGEIGDRLVIVTLRGKRLDIDALERYFATLTPRQFDLIIIDPLYKTFPREFDENSNVQLAEVYAKLQAYAERLDAAIIVVHHLTKGDQSFKATTDLGAGGGSQSRAADAHLAIRPHKEDGAAVLSGVVRSFPPFEPFAMRWTFPVWQRADDLNPADLKRPTRQKAKEVIPPPPPKPAWDVDRFVSSFVTSEPKPRVAIIAAAVEAGVPNNNQAANLLATAEALGKIHRWKQGKDKRAFFANRPQPTLPAVELPTSDIHTQKKKSPHTPLRRQKPLRGWGRFR